MPARLALAHITLHVEDLALCRGFYVDRLGFHPQSVTSEEIELAPTPEAAPLLTLRRAPVSRAHPRRATAGLFHAALLFPTRAGLASWLAFAAQRRVAFDGFSDHGVSEAVYFSDPEGNGLEFYADRPRTDWPFRNGELAMTTRPLDVAQLLTEAAPTSTPLGGTRWGHLHLRVTELERSEAFYREHLGVEVTQRSYPGARFLAADGYHHHLGLNTWGAPHAPATRGAAGLASATWTITGVTGGHLIHDPDNLSHHLGPART
jgi:catechol 2,3-dioxygenase